MKPSKSALLALCLLAIVLVASAWRPYDNPYDKPTPYEKPTPSEKPKPYDKPIPYGKPKTYDKPTPYGKPKPYDKPTPYEKPKPYDKPTPYGKPKPYKEPVPYKPAPPKCSPIEYFVVCFPYVRKSAYNYGKESPPAYWSPCCELIRKETPDCICKAATYKYDVDLSKALSLPKACGKKDKGYYPCAPKPMPPKKEYPPPTYYKYPPPEYSPPPYKY